MKLFYVIAYLLIVGSLVISVLPANAATYNSWNANSNVVSGLPTWHGMDKGYARCSVAYDFDDNGKFTMIEGVYDGTVYGYTFSGTTWLSDSSVIAGLPDIGFSTSPSFAYNVTGDGTWICIFGQREGTSHGYTWNSSTGTWVGNASVVSGIADVGYNSSPYLVYGFLASKWAVFIGRQSGGAIASYYWETSAWVSNTTLVSGIPTVPLNGNWRPSVYYNLLGNSKWVMIMGKGSAAWSGYSWSDSTWSSDSDVVLGLTRTDDNSHASFVFNLLGDGSLSLVTTWQYIPLFKGFTYLGDEPLPQTNSNRWLGIAAPHVYAAITIWSIAMIVGIGLVFMRGQNDLSALPIVILLGIGILICLFISLAVMSGFLRL